MQFAIARPDIVRAINQRWLLKFWERHLVGHRVPQWQAVEAADLSRVSAGLSFLDVVAGDRGLRFQIRFHGPTIATVYGAPDCRGKFLHDSRPEPERTQKLAPYRKAAESGRPVYTIHDVTDRNGRLVYYERLLLPFSRDGETVDRILASFEFICEDGAFEGRELMTSPAVPPALRLSAMIETRASA